MPAAFKVAQKLTAARDQELTVSTRVKEKASSGSNADKSMASEKIKDTVNQVSTKETLSHTTLLPKVSTLPETTPEAL